MNERRGGNAVAVTALAKASVENREASDQFVHWLNDWNPAVRDDARLALSHVVNELSGDLALGQDPPRCARSSAGPSPTRPWPAPTRRIV